ncbi:MAG: hypothetical protein CLLPBCKN_000220 [Chroococcidiopsis cubana SAG 39.79]|nr:hypothetical protein [Chroococcidiopsis cubana SAG 39.79]
MVLPLFCYFRQIQRIYVVLAYEKSRFHPSLTEEGLRVYLLQIYV